MTSYKFGYARVSTKDQDPAAQIKALEHAGCDRIFVEFASGAKADRPKLTEMLSLARRGDTIVIWKLDRLARSLNHLLELSREFQMREVGLHSLTDSLDTTTASGKLLFHILGAMAQFESDLQKERTHAGIARARAQGVKCGRKPTAMDKIVSARAMVLGGMSIRQAAKAVGVSAATLGRAGINAEVMEQERLEHAQNVTYIGKHRAA
jgi:DNA invertase Pin-like site-specific DNA recombinase